MSEQELGLFYKLFYDWLDEEFDSGLLPGEITEKAVELLEQIGQGEYDL